MATMDTATCIEHMKASSSVRKLITISTAKVPHFIA